MPDDIDRAQERDAQYTADCIAEQHYQAARAAPVETGYCSFCGEPLEGRRFCDVDCRDAWDYEQRLRRMRGVG